MRRVRPGWYALRLPRGFCLSHRPARSRVDPAIPGGGSKPHSLGGACQDPGVDRSIDLFDDAPWSTEVPVDHRVRSVTPVVARRVAGARRPALGQSRVALVQEFRDSRLDAVFELVEPGLGTRDEELGPSRLGPGRGGGCFHRAWRSRPPRNAWTGLVFLAATALVVVTLLEASAQLSVNPGPNLHADYGAWIGSAAAVLAWMGIAVVAALQLAGSLCVATDPTAHRSQRRTGFTQSIEGKRWRC